MAGTPGRKGKHPRGHQFTDPLVGARRNIKTEISRVHKKLRHWVKRGMSPKRECYLNLESYIVRLESHLASIQYKSSPDMAKKSEKSGKEK